MVFDVDAVENYGDDCDDYADANYAGANDGTKNADQDDFADDANVADVVFDDNNYYYNYDKYYFYYYFYHYYYLNYYYYYYDYNGYY